MAPCSGGCQPLTWELPDYYSSATGLLCCVTGNCNLSPSFRGRIAGWKRKGWSNVGLSSEATQITLLPNPHFLPKSLTALIKAFIFPAALLAPRLLELVVLGCAKMLPQIEGLKVQEMCFNHKCVSFTLSLQILSCWHGQTHQQWCLDSSIKEQNLFAICAAQGNMKQMLVLCWEGLPTFWRSSTTGFFATSWGAVLGGHKPYQSKLVTKNHP